MTTQIDCPACGGRNEIGRMFCRHCGARLNLTAIRPPGPARRRRHALRRFLRVLFLLALIAVAGLVLWPVEPTGREGTEQDAQTLRRSFLGMELAMKRGRSAAERVSEEQLNAYLDGVVRHTAEEGETAPMVLEVRRINVAFTPERIVVLMAAGWGPVTLTYEILGVPAVGEGGFRLEIAEARLGHLPLPGPLKVQVGKRAARAFAGLRRERAVLDAVTAVSLDRGVVGLAL
ncbi:MAG: zinc ribbon domain-containing protein [Kiritimatiellae bacterium]|nr:zinc ribbon domain-containing protein [Kiritimatiellia bacterium]